MKVKKNNCILLMVLLLSVLICGNSWAEQFTIAIMQDQKGAAQEYKPLVDYMKIKGVDISFISAPDYPESANMFADGKVDAMFSGSGIAGSMIIKNVAYPSVRPIGKDGTSTYWAVILAPKGSAKYADSNEYFKGKKVVYCSLSSSGEFFFRSIGGHKTAGSIMKASSHGVAIETLSKGGADVAIVKNRVWDKMKSKYPNLELVGMDNEKNPDGTLIISSKVDPKVAEKVKSALLALKNDNSPEAKVVLDGLNIQGYIETSKGEFSHTISLLKRAGVDKSFNFSF